MLKRFLTLVMLVSIMLGSVAPILAQEGFDFQPTISDWMPNLPAGFGGVDAEDLVLELVENAPILIDVRNPEELATFVRRNTVAQHWLRLNIVRRHLVRVYSQMSLEDFYRPRLGSDSYCSAEWVMHELCQYEAECRNEISGLLAAARKALKSETLL